MTKSPPWDSTAEWLEADGLGGFASGTVVGRRTRRYHALLLAATTPPTGRYVLVNGFDAWVDCPAGNFAISSQKYTPDATYPDGERRLVSFESEPWPTWTFHVDDGIRLEQELFVPKGHSAVVVRWRLLTSTGSAMLIVRPFLSGRDYHALHRENPTFRFEAEGAAGRVTWRPYRGLPGVAVFTNGEYAHLPVWYRSFLYDEERARGLEDTEDLASPGVFRWDLAKGEAIWILSTTELGSSLSTGDRSPVDLAQQLREAEQTRRQRFASPLHRATDAYLVPRGSGKTILAGYPWFTDWGRDTFIALRGLCLAAGRLDDAGDILLAWSSLVSRGMLPNRFVDQGDAAEFNSVDASLWYIVAVHDFFQAMARSGKPVERETRERLQRAVTEILTGYSQGTRNRIRADDDGLLAAGERGVQLTWMDAKVSDWVVTPRIGKPVEVQALWLNALWIAGHFSEEWKPLLARGGRSFRERSWNAAAGCLHDVVDSDHRPGVSDSACRPNQIFAVGGLPLALLDGEQAKRIVEKVESCLLTPLGLRSLAPGSAGYRPIYQGGVRERDGAYHQGTAWPWLLGPFVEAWLRVRGDTPANRSEARERFLAPLVKHLETAGLGHVSEIADGDAPHTPRGCPFQAWSVGELLRLEEGVLKRPA